jgi:hypothetical protein
MRPLPHRRDGGCGDQGPDTRDRLDTSARLGLRGPDRQFPCRVVNLVVEREPPSSLAMQDLKETWRESTLCLEERRGQAPAEARAPDRRDDPVLKQEAPHLVDDRRPFPDDALAHAMERL